MMQPLHKEWSLISQVWVKLVPVPVTVVWVEVLIVVIVQVQVAGFLLLQLGVLLVGVPFVVEVVMVGPVSPV